jgi:hypothetical protein
MIQVNESYRALSEFVDDPRYLEMSAVTRRDMGPTALASGATAGLRHRGSESGASYMVHERNGTKYQVERRDLYAICPLGEEPEAAARVVEHIAAKHGPGDWWTVGAQPVDYCGDDGKIPCGDIDGIPHILLRSYYYHSGEALP